MSSPKSATITRGRHGRPVRIRAGVRNRVVFPRNPVAGGLEMISATQSSDTRAEGFFTRRICALMGQHQGLRFVDAARRVARRNSGADGDLPARSGQNLPDFDVATGRLPLRFALVLANAAYPRSPLPDVAADTAPGGRLRVALARDYGAELRILHDQGGRAMRGAVRRAIESLSGRLVDGQLGELLVNFQGHGGPSGFVGVDGQSLNLLHLQGLANIARRSRVQLIVVSDACQQGAGTALAQLDQNRALRERVRAAGGLPAAERRELMRTLEGCRPLIRLAGAASQPLARLQHIAEGQRSGAERDAEYARLGRALGPFREALRRDTALRRALRTDLDMVVGQPCLGDRFPLRSRATLRDFCARFNGLLDRLNEAVAELQERVQRSLALRGLDR